MLSAIKEVIKRIDFIASSLPGIGKSIKSGSQFVSIRPAMGMESLRASLTAVSSCLESTTNKTPGKLTISFIPERFLSNLSFSLVN